MTNEQVAAMIGSALAAGCGALIQYLYEWWLSSRPNNGDEISAFHKRLVVMSLCLVVPSLLYGLLVFAGTTNYEVLLNVGYCSMAFVVTQGIHSRKLEKLPKTDIEAKNDKPF